MTLYERMKKYKVEADSVEDFLNKYYKPERYTDRGEEYAQYLLQQYKEELKEKGYCFISGHDCVMGRAVAYYGDKE